MTSPGAIEEQNRRRMKPTPASGTSRLSTCLARLACDVDQVVCELTSEPLGDADVYLLAAPAGHLDLANDRLQDVLYQLEKLDLRTAWPRHGSGTPACRGRATDG